MEIWERPNIRDIRIRARARTLRVFIALVDVAEMKERQK